MCAKECQSTLMYRIYRDAIFNIMNYLNSGGQKIEFTNYWHDPSYCTHLLSRSEKFSTHIAIFFNSTNEKSESQIVRINTVMVDHVHTTSTHLVWLYSGGKH